MPTIRLTVALAMGALDRSRHGRLLRRLADSGGKVGQSRRGRRRPVDALERAIANGFRDRDRIEHEPLFDRLRNDPRFSAAISALKQ